MEMNQLNDMEEIDANVNIPTFEVVEKIAIIMWKLIGEAKAIPSLKRYLDIFTLPFSSLHSIDNIRCRGFIRANFNRRDSHKIAFQYTFKSFVANTNGCCYHEEEETYNREKDESTYTYYEKTETLECSYEKVLAYLTNVFRNEIPSLKYNCLTSTFEPEDISELNNLFGKMFTQIPNINVHKEVCCVCLETTKFRTSCNHPICPPCLDRIIITPVVCSHAETRCPICRKSITDGNLIIEE